ncbi:tyrosine-type recombinase/integrase [Halocatena salina]|uniref:Tyrosine-type recombinase/integrase n=1 Tax=Halocatena salina TaxID=2934340 RepID=A0A8U0A296_9EURY|nr:tyrosine-type recombinase/integrase [Halocatena salina]UPM43311.1 tyrosine-type recombinase/integrase [Halocatena salina]
MKARTDSDGSDPITYFIDDLTYHGKSERTLKAYERVLRRFERFVADRDATPATATQRDCMAFVHSLRDSLATSTVASYASYVHRFYAYMTQTGELDTNPMTLVMAEMDESINTDPTRREISIEEMRTFLDEITHPLERTVTLLLLKTGLRVGECCNLDLRDLNLDAPAVRAEYDYTHRPQLDGRADTLFVSNDIAAGQTVNGEERTASNKRKRVTMIPIDAELKETLIRWLAIRPGTPSSAKPLFADTGRSWGHRLKPSQVRTFVRRHAERRGWYRVGGGASENVTPHYFRHFFTTYLRDRTGDRGIVKYLRGDVAQDIIDTYTHDWGNRVRAVYESNIYSLR